MPYRHPAVLFMWLILGAHMAPCLLWAADVAGDSSGFRKAMAQVYKSVSVKPLVLSKSALNSEDRLKGRVSIVIAPGKNHFIPQDPVKKNAIIWTQHWFLHRLDALKKEDPRLRNSLGVSKSALIGGEEFPLEEEVEAKHLPSGRYALMFVLTGVNGEAVGSATAAFTVNNPDFVDVSRRMDGLAAHARQIFGNLRMQEIKVSHATVKKGVAVEVSSALVNISNAHLVLPDDVSAFDHAGPPGSQSRADVVMGWAQWSVMKGDVDFIKGYGGDIFLMPDKSGFPASHTMPFKRSIDTKAFATGQYEVQFKILDFSGRLVGLKKQRFRVIN